MSDTRKTINGLRHYLCPGVPDYLPSVTSILSATQSAKTQQKLAHWNIMNPGAADEAAESEAGDSLSKRGERLSSALSSKNIQVSKSINSKGKISVDR